jgi:hypothetical protein
VGRLAEAEHERLGRRVGRRPRHRLKGGHRGDVDHDAATAFGHPRRVSRLQVEHRDAVELDHLDESLAVGVGEVGGAAEARVVDEDLDLEAELFEAGGNEVAPGLRREVGADCLGADAVLLRERAGELAQAILAARDERDPVTAGGQLARDRVADARRGPGDQRGRSLGWRRQGDRASLDDR